MKDTILSVIVIFDLLVFLNKETERKSVFIKSNVELKWCGICAANIETLLALIW